MKLKNVVISSEKYCDYHFMIQVKPFTKCQKVSGNFLSMSEKKSGSFFSDLSGEP